MIFSTTLTIAIPYVEDFLYATASSQRNRLCFSWTVFTLLIYNRKKLSFCTLNTIIWVNIPQQRPNTYALCPWNMWCRWCGTNDTSLASIIAIIGTCFTIIRTRVPKSRTYTIATSLSWISYWSSWTVLTSLVSYDIILARSTLNTFSLTTNNN